MYGVGIFKSRRSEVLCRWVVAVRLVETASFFLFSFVFFVAAHPGRRASLQRLSSFYGRFYKLALTDCETVFEVNLFVGEGVWRAV